MSNQPPGLATVGSVAESFVDGPFGSNLKTEHYRSSGVRVIRLQNIADGRFENTAKAYIAEEHAKTLSRHDARPGDVLIAAMGDVLPRACLVPTYLDWAIVKADCFRLRPRRGVIPEYLVYILSAPQTREQASTKIAGVGRPRLNLRKVSALEIPVPSQEEQERTVATIDEQFSRLDAGIAALECARQNLRNIRKAVLRAAVTGQLVAQDDAEGSGADLLANIDVIGRRSRREHDKLTTDLPPLPPNWSTAPWSRIGYSQNGRFFPSFDYSVTGVRLLRPGNLYASGQIGWTRDNTRCMPERYASNFPDHVVRGGEIVMNLTAQSLKDEFLGRVCMTAPEEQPMLLNQRIARLTPITMEPRFIFYVLQSPIFRRFVDRLNTGSLIQHMFTSQLDQFIFPIPPLKEQIRIAETLEDFFAFFERIDEIIVNAGKRASLLRMAILEAAFSGKLV